MRGKRRDGDGDHPLNRRGIDVSKHARVLTCISCQRHRRAAKRSSTVPPYGAPYAIHIIGTAER
eukprot:51543-Prymnesium_polylepis.1